MPSRHAVSRRSLLGGAALVALTGCGLLPDRATPSIAPTPDASVPGHEALQSLRAALDAAAATPLPRPQADLVAWALDVNDDQHRAVSLALPATHRPLGTALEAALAEAASALATQALDATTARPLVWASMAAWCVALGSQLPDATAAREPARGVRLPTPQDPDAAAQSALDAAGATLFGLQVAAGAPGLPAEESAALRRRLTLWSGLRDDLTALIRQTPASPTPAPPWFDVSPPGDAASARAGAARLQAAALPVLGRSLAHGTAGLRELLAPALGDIAADVPRWGGLLERWPGLPLT